MTNHTAVFIGEQTLLIQCCELWAERDNHVVAIVSENDSITRWAMEKDIQVYAPRSDYVKELAAEQYDYLFSITNLRVLQESLLSQPVIGAINFHDGPLPAYAGLNVPAWAIANGEKEHGVTFHRMTSDVDAGDILCQRLFPISPDDTTFTLNVKCYQTAEELFHELLTLLDADDISPIEGSSRPWSYFGLGKRPAAAGVVDFDNDAADLDRILRSMDYGPYANPLSYPKFVSPTGGFAFARSASAAQSDDTSVFGTVLSIDDGQIVVACRGGAVTFTDVQHVDGAAFNAAAAGVTTSSTLLSVSSVDQEGLSAWDDRCGRSEGIWQRRLKLADPIQIPYAVVGTDTAGDYAEVSQELSKEVVSTVKALFEGGSSMASVMGLYLARLTGKSAVTVATSVADLEGQCEAVQTLNSPCVPVSVQFSVDETARDFIAAQCTRFADVTKHGSFNTDLYAREPSLHHVTRCEHYQVLVRIGATSVPFGNSHALIVDIAADQQSVTWRYRTDSLDASKIERMRSQFEALVADLATRPDSPASRLEIVSDDEQALMLRDWNATTLDHDRESTMHGLFERFVAETPDAIAVEFEGTSVTYAELNARANRLANFLRLRNLGDGQIVGVLVDRSIEMISTLLGVLKSGSAYLPLDPVYPADRLTYMVADSKAAGVVLNDHYADLLEGSDSSLVRLNMEGKEIAASSDGNPGVSVSSYDLSYLIYTSGSTGRPKGVMVEHRNAVNFFAGMDHSVEKGPGKWLAVTSISFDISVLELFWTLGRGFTVLLYADEKRQQSDAQKARSKYPGKDLDLSLFYWNVADDDSIYNADKYRLLLEGAKFADSNGFKAVWNPERHFAAFGGLFPNPAVTLAALATITENVDLRAGSCVLPLHSPIRVAEEYAVVDNLSNGRVGIAAASGWAPPDFAIKPENFENAKGKMFESVEVVRKLWRGDTVPFDGPKGEVLVRTLPRPIQDDIPIWITTAGNIDSFKGAAKIGANVLTHLLGQTIEEVGEKIMAYREAWKEAGHPGEGCITLMLHTFVGPNIDEVEGHVRGPLKSYLKSAMFLVKSAAWNFPTFKQMSEETGKSLDEFFETISDEDLNDLLDFSFERYFRTSGLFGDYAMCIERLDECKSIGVDEIACLIDFGIDTDLVLDHLPFLAEVRSRAARQDDSDATDGDFSMAGLLREHDVTHLQCTPSMASMIAGDSDSRGSLAKLKQLMVGGEALPAALARDLVGVVGGRVTNMYGPTETTIWSSTHDIGDFEGQVSIGTPIANTQLYIVDENLQLLPIGVPGELVIAGEGVVRGYHQQPELTAERFVPDPWSDIDGARMYRTGDLAKFESDGTVSYLGRLDHQVKVRGYRIELGEVESLLLEHPSVYQGVVVLREDVPGDKRLVAYVCVATGQEINGDVLRAYLLESLPDFMVPSLFITLPALPLTPNGKVSRNDLPAPKAERTSSKTAAPPVNEWEALIAEIWTAALGVAEVGTKDNFFDIGGHSLLAISILKQLRDCEKITKPLQMTDLFRYTTIEQLAQFIADSGDDGPSMAEKGQARAAARREALARRRGRGR
jgi:natural product biosynthesis luciferase-like monooxygenase protein